MGLIDHLRRRPTPEQVVCEYGEDVARQLRRTFGPRADIDDVYQAVFVEIIRSLPRFRGKSKLRTWIYRITMNVAYQEMRLQYREREVRSTEDIDYQTIGDPTGTGDFERAESRKMLYKGLSRLTAKKRIAVVMHDVEGHTLQEISEMLGRPLQTVASQVRTGRAELARWFTECEGTTTEVRRRLEVVRS